MKKLLMTAGVATMASLTAVAGVSGLVSAQSTKAGSPAMAQTAAIDSDGAADNTAKEVAAQAGTPEKEVTEHTQNGEDEAQVKQSRQASLNLAVSEGKLTQAQADDLMAHMEALMPQRVKAGFEGKTLAEREAITRAAADTYNQWAVTSGIPQQYLPVVQFDNGLSIQEMF